MTMTIKDKTVELKYHFDYRELREDQAFATGENRIMNVFKNKLLNLRIIFQIWNIQMITWRT